MSLIVRPAHAEDFDAILRINSQSAPHVAKLDAQDLQRLVKLASVAWVAQSPTGIAGYLLGMASYDDYDGEEFGCFVSRLDQTFLHVDQVAVGSNARRANIASQLYEHLVQWSLKRNICVLCCGVNLVPPNPVSMEFHQQRGFEKLDELRTSDGQLVALLCKLIPRHG
jgi:predicted GNAT superfamily acetyltransferase